MRAPDPPTGLHRGSPRFLCQGRSEQPVAAFLQQGPCSMRSSLEHCARGRGQPTSGH